MAKAKRSTVKVLIQRHSRLVTFVGALIVFVTFLVKEGKQETLKKTLATFNQARDVFSMKKDNAFLVSRLAVLEYETDRISTQLKQVNKPFDKTEYTVNVNDQYLADAKRILIGTAYSLSYIRLLVKAMPPDRTRSLLQSLDNLEAAQKRLWEGSKPGDDGKFAAQDISDDSSDFESRVASLSDEAIETSEPYRKDLELSYERYVYLAYGLYTLGWGLGLIGRLYGAGGDDATA